MKSKYELATVLRKYEAELQDIVPNSWKYRTLYALARCRTAAMGGHIDACNNPHCRKLHVSYNSCRNRHCPKCQGHLKEKWIQAREQELLNCNYFHVVFTLPHELNEVALEQPTFYYNTLFRVAWGVLKGFGNNPKYLGAQMGMIAILHTWGQNLSLHPHLHCIVPGGGITQSGKWKNTKSNGKYLFDVKQLSKVFRAQFVDALTQKIRLKSSIRKALFAKKWVVYAKQPFYGPRQVVEYLGRYTHKIAISNHRIKGITKDSVLFSAKDYRHNGRKYNCSLQHRDFIKRFALHILPKGFTRIRHYGMLSSGKKKEFKRNVDHWLGKLKQLERPKQLKHRRCPSCKVGLLEIIYTFDPRGPPADWKTRFTY